MKKLMFALIAGVAVSAAQAVDVFAEGEGFEGAAVDAAATTLANFSYVPSSQSQDDSKVASEVSAFDGKRALYFSTNGVSNTKYLNLSTDGGVLYRSINAPENENPIGEARALTQSFYIDTLVQFTVCDSAPTIDSGAKLAIWLQASDDETTTNLMVQAKQWAVAAQGANAAGFTSLGTTNLVLSGNYDAGAWYRLTVEAVPNLFTKANGRYATGFKVKINGSEVHATNSRSFVLAAAQEATLAELLERHANADEVAAMTGGTVFASIADESTIVDNSPSIAAVGFSGTGLVDEILFTDHDPDVVPVFTLDFTITLAGGATVKYAIGEDAPESLSDTRTIQVNPSSTVTLSDLGAGINSDGWTVESSQVTATNNCTMDGLVVTMPASGAASVTITRAAAPITTAAEVSDALSQLGIDNASILAYVTTPERYSALCTWAINKYDTDRVNDYLYAVDRMTNNLPIEVAVKVSFDPEAVVNDDQNTMTITGDADGNLDTDGADYIDNAIYATVDAGYGFSVSGIAVANGKQLAAAADEGWNLGGMTVSVADGVVSYVTTLDAGKVKYGENDEYDAIASIATKSSAPTTYDFTVTFGATISGVSYVIGEGESTAASNGQTIVVPVGDTITFTPVAAGGLLQPAVKAVTDNGATTNAVNTTYAAAAAGAVEFFAEATAYGVTVTFGAGVTGAQYAITPDGASGSAADATQIAVPNGKTITFTPAASGLALPLFYTLADAGATTNYFATKEYTAAAADTFYAIAAAQAPGDDAAVETATKNAIADAATAAEGAAVAAAVETKLEALDAAGISATEVAAWKTATASAVTYEAFANNANVAESIKLDTAVLFNKEPEAVVSAAEEGSVAGKYELTFTITDGQNTATPANTDAVKAYVESLVQMTSDLSDWTVGAGKPGIAPTVDVTVDGSTLKATVNKPAGESTVFMKIGK